jgi:hypothetical protein
MSETKFTRGPWLIERRATKEGGPHHTIGVTRDEISGGVFGTHSSGRYMSVSGCIDEHDAALIAAAPDLYEALSDLFENKQFNTAIGGNPIMVDKLIERIWAALKKARGET